MAVFLHVDVAPKHLEFSSPGLDPGSRFFPSLIKKSEIPDRVRDDDVLALNALTNLDRPM